MKSLVIFDLDGTLLNTIEDLGLATNHALAECGFQTHDLSGYTMMVGGGVTRLIERALPADRRDPETIETVRRSFMDYYDRFGDIHTTPYPGIPELLASLRRQGVDVAVASNKYQKAVTRLIAKNFPTIEWAAVVGHREGWPLKPDPSIVFGILQERPTPKDEVLYVGDSGVDMETARRACVESVGVTWGFRPYKELRDYYAGHIVNRPDEILEIAEGRS